MVFIRYDAVHIWSWRFSNFAAVINWMLICDSWNSTMNTSYQLSLGGHQSWNGGEGEFNACQLYCTFKMVRTNSRNCKDATRHACGTFKFAVRNWGLAKGTHLAFVNCAAPSETAHKQRRFQKWHLSCVARHLITHNTKYTRKKIVRVFQ